MPKGCLKICLKAQTVENQALAEILYAFTHMRKNRPPKPDRPTPTPHPLKTDFFNTFTHNRNMRNKMRKILENQGFGFLG